ncbi:stage III sporulation protein AD [Paraliobacillus quinghaiensis]|uniref:Stage III sporulation protein AD n=1 Tax=Paraliobacillus quinghaiensis TaxID=470815 RepID=A0A917TVP4_9BACI|nr:stage III sporulation protein AD [Paraliobacillus quinghaiensis]GGM40219.1 stage III sporulation protein AD [Paraliobacillus quinghaiensis]
MVIIQIVTIAIVASLLVLLVKEQQPIFAFVITILTGVILFFFIIESVTEVIDLIRSLSKKANINEMYLETILQIIGISYIAEFGSQLTKDAGLASVAAKIELAGKIFIIVLAVPILTAVVETILNFLPQ